MVPKSPPTSAILVHLYSLPIMRFSGQYIYMYSISFTCTIYYTSNPPNPCPQGPTQGFRKCVSFFPCYGLPWAEIKIFIKTTLLGSFERCWFQQQQQINIIWPAMVGRRLLVVQSDFYDLLEILQNLNFTFLFKNWIYYLLFNLLKILPTNLQMHRSFPFS